MTKCPFPSSFLSEALIVECSPLYARKNIPALIIEYVFLRFLPQTEGFIAVYRLSYLTEAQAVRRVLFDSPSPIAWRCVLEDETHQQTRTSGNSEAKWGDQEALSPQGTVELFHSWPLFSRQLPEMPKASFKSNSKTSQPRRTGGFSTL